MISCGSGSATSRRRIGAAPLRHRGDAPGRLVAAWSAGRASPPNRAPRPFRAARPSPSSSPCGTRRRRSTRSSIRFWPAPALPTRSSSPTASTDRTVERLRARAAADPRVRYLTAPGNRSVGRNAAVRASSAPLIACTDAGVRVERDWLERITAPFQADPATDVVAGFYRPAGETWFERAAGRRSSRRRASKGGPKPVPPPRRARSPSAAPPGTASAGSTCAGTTTRTHPLRSR